MHSGTQTEVRVYGRSVWSNWLNKDFLHFFTNFFFFFGKLVQLAFNPFLGMISGTRIRHYEVRKKLLTFSFVLYNKSISISNDIIVNIDFLLFLKKYIVHIDL